MLRRWKALLLQGIFRLRQSGPAGQVRWLQIGEILAHIREHFSIFEFPFSTFDHRTSAPGLCSLISMCDFDFLIPGGAAPHFLAHFSAKHQRHHLLVRPPRPERVFQGGRLVVLHKEVPDPGQGVGNQERQRDPPPALQRATAATNSAHPTSVPVR